jgi:hypothetical protein
LRGYAGLEFPELIRSADKHHIDGIDAPAHLIRSGDLDEHAANNYANHVCRADENQRNQRKNETVGKAEKNGEKTKTGHAP